MIEVGAKVRCYPYSVSEASHLSRSVTVDADVLYVNEPNRWFTVGYHVRDREDVVLRESFSFNDIGKLVLV